MEAAPHPWPAIGSLMLRDGIVTKDQLEDVLRAQHDSPQSRISGWRLGELLIERGLVTQGQVAKLVAEQYELPYLELDETRVDHRVSHLLPPDMIERFSALPIESLPDGSLMLAVSDPATVLFSDELRRTLGRPLRFTVVAPDAMEALLARESAAQTEPESTESAMWPSSAVSFDFAGEQTADEVLSDESALHGSAVTDDGDAESNGGPAPVARSCPPLGTLLVRDGFVTDDELEAALAQQRLSSTKRLGEILVERGSVTRADIARVVAEQYELPFIDLATFELDPRVGSLLPQDIAERFSALPLDFLADGSLRVAVADPTKVLDPEEILAALGARLTFAVADPDAVESALAQHRPDESSATLTWPSLAPIGPPVSDVADPATETTAEPFVTEHADVEPSPEQDASDLIVGLHTDPVEVEETEASETELGAGRPLDEIETTPDVEGEALVVETEPAEEIIERRTTADVDAPSVESAPRKRGLFSRFRKGREEPLAPSEPEAMVADASTTHDPGSLDMPPVDETETEAVATKDPDDTDPIAGLLLAGEAAAGPENGGVADVDHTDRSAEQAAVLRLWMAGDAPAAHAEPTTHEVHVETQLGETETAETQEEQPTGEHEDASIEATAHDDAPDQSADDVPEDHADETVTGLALVSWTTADESDQYVDTVTELAEPEAAPVGSTFESWLGHEEPAPDEPAEATADTVDEPWVELHETEPVAVEHEDDGALEVQAETETFEAEHTDTVTFGEVEELDLRTSDAPEHTWATDEHFQEAHAETETVDVEHAETFGVAEAVFEVSDEPAHEPAESETAAVEDVQEHAEDAEGEVEAFDAEHTEIQEPKRWTDAAAEHREEHDDSGFEAAWVETEDSVEVTPTVVELHPVAEVEREHEPIADVTDDVPEPRADIFKHEAWSTEAGEAETETAAEPTWPAPELAIVAEPETHVEESETSGPETTFDQEPAAADATEERTELAWVDEIIPNDTDDEETPWMFVPAEEHTFATEPVGDTEELETQQQPAATDEAPTDEAHSALEVVVAMSVPAAPATSETVEVALLQPSQEPAEDALAAIVERATALGATTLHFSAQEHGIVVRARVDGVLRKLDTVTGGDRFALARELSSAAHSGTLAGGRVTALPTPHGETIAVRFRQSGSVATLESLSLDLADREALERALAQPFGLVLIAGPAGSGQAGTLAAALNELASAERAVMTIEDPILHVVPGADQVAVDHTAGRGFADGLRQILAADPDVIVVGELADEETTRLALDAAASNVVASTVVAQSAVGAIDRLDALGVDADLVASTLSIVVAQRLVRRLCDHCREGYYATASDIVALRRPEDEIGRRLLGRSIGCAECGETGYAGTIGMYEVLVPNDEVRALVAAGAPAAELERAARLAGKRTLADDGVRICLEGLTTVSEVQRVLGRTLV